MFSGCTQTTFSGVEIRVSIRDRNEGVTEGYDTEDSGFFEKFVTEQSTKKPIMSWFFGIFVTLCIIMH